MHAPIWCGDNSFALWAWKGDYLNMGPGPRSISTAKVVLLDPSVFMVRGNDRSTVEVLTKLVAAGLESLSLNHEERVSMMSMLEDNLEWLATGAAPEA